MKSQFLYMSVCLSQTPLSLANWFLSSESTSGDDFLCPYSISFMYMQTNICVCIHMHTSPSFFLYKWWHARQNVLYLAFSCDGVSWIFKPVHREHPHFFLRLLSVLTFGFCPLGLKNKMKQPPPPSWVSHATWVWTQCWPRARYDNIPALDFE